MQARHVVIDKEEDRYIAKYLHHKEFKCQCKDLRCTFTIMDSKLLSSFELLRKKLDMPLIITSGYRCINHNSMVKGNLFSKHKKGQAIDIANTVGDIEMFANIARRYFDIVLVYKEKNFIHCHNN